MATRDRSRIWLAVVGAVVGVAVGILVSDDGRSSCAGSRTAARCIGRLVLDCCPLSIESGGCSRSSRSSRALVRWFDSGR